MKPTVQKSVLALQLYIFKLFLLQLLKKCVKFKKKPRKINYGWYIFYPTHIENCVMHTYTYTYTYTYDVLIVNFDLFFKIKFFVKKGIKKTTL